MNHRKTINLFIYGAHIINLTSEDINNDLYLSWHLFYSMI